MRFRYVNALPLIPLAGIVSFCRMLSRPSLWEARCVCLYSFLRVAFSKYLLILWAGTYVFLHRNLLSAILCGASFYGLVHMLFLGTLVPFPQLRRNECFMFNCFVVSGTSGCQGRADGSSHGFCFKDSLSICRHDDQKSKILDYSPARTWMVFKSIYWTWRPDDDSNYLCVA